MNSCKKNCQAFLAMRPRQLNKKEGSVLYMYLRITFCNHHRVGIVMLLKSLHPIVHITLLWSKWHKKQHRRWKIFFIFIMNNQLSYMYKAFLLQHFNSVVGLLFNKSYVVSRLWLCPVHDVIAAGCHSWYLYLGSTAVLHTAGYRQLTGQGDKRIKRIHNFTLTKRNVK